MLALGFCRPAEELRFDDRMSPTLRCTFKSSRDQRWIGVGRGSAVQERRDRMRSPTSTFQRISEFNCIRGGRVVVGV